MRGKIEKMLMLIEDCEQGVAMLVDYEETEDDPTIWLKESLHILYLNNELDIALEDIKSVSFDENDGMTTICIETTTCPITLYIK